MFVHRKKGFVWKFLISAHFIDVLGRLLKKGCGYFYKGNKKVPRPKRNRDCLICKM